MRSSPTDTCFVVSPPREPHDTYFSHIIKPAVEACGFDAVRQNSLHRPGAKMDDIWDAIQAAKLLVAELTGRDPGVFYQLGLAHALSKPVILVSETVDDVPFDLRAGRILLYDKTHPEWGRILRQNLTNSLKEVRQYPTAAIPTTFKTPVPIDPPAESETLVRLEALEAMVQRLVAGVEGVPPGEAAQLDDSERRDLAPLRVGQRVSHRLLGKGEVLAVEGSGSSGRVKVNFDRAGLKWMTPSLSPIQVLSN